jgi:hypothetical protein
MKNALSLLLVCRFVGSEGGASKKEFRVCAVGDDANDTSLAHEFGHLLWLDHQGDIRDLMNPGLAVPGAPLTQKEIGGNCSTRLTEIGKLRRSGTSLPIICRFSIP